MAADHSEEAAAAEADLAAARLAEAVTDPTTITTTDTTTDRSLDLASIDLIITAEDASQAFSEL